MLKMMPPLPNSSVKAKAIFQSNFIFLKDHNFSPIASPPELIVDFALRDKDTQLWKYVAAVGPTQRETLFRLLKQAVDPEWKPPQPEPDPTPEPEPVDPTRISGLKNSKQREFQVLKLDKVEDIPDFEFRSGAGLKKWRAVRRETVERIKKFFGYETDKELQAHFDDPNLNLNILFHKNNRENGFRCSFKPETLVDVALEDYETPLWMYFSLVDPSERETFLVY